MAADDDLFTALKMFGTGVKQYQVQSAIGDANDYVQQLKAADLSDQQKRSELQGLSNQLVMHLSGLGVQSDQVKQAAAAVAPQAFEDANAMNKEALLSGNQDLADEAQQQKDFEDQNKGKDAPDNTDRQNERFTNHMEKLNKMIDPQVSRFGNIAKLQGSNNQIRDMQPILNDPKQWTPQAMSETVRKLDAVLSQGASTVAGSEHLTPQIRAKYQAEFKQLISNRPQAMDAVAFQKYYRDTFSRINDINEKTIEEGQLQAVRGELPALMKQFPDSTKDIEASISNKLGTPVVVDPVTKNIDTEANIETQDQYAKAIEKAAANPNDPRVPAVMNELSKDDRNLKRTLLRYPNLRSKFGKLK